MFGSSQSGRTTMTVGLPLVDSSISMRFLGYCKDSEQQPCDSCVRAVRVSHDSTISIRFLAPMSTENRLFAARTVCLLATVLRFVFQLYKFLLNKTVEAARGAHETDRKSHSRMERGKLAGYMLRKFIIGQT